ncbi:MAG: AbrB/MazE/SpoVT family DNA-binding domain-containing protein [Patescibacteria group bacterium]
MAQKVIKTGNSAALTIPAEFVRDLGIRIGDPVKTRLEKDRGRITYFFSGVKQLPLSENFLHRKKR